MIASSSFSSEAGNKDIVYAHLGYNHALYTIYINLYIFMVGICWYVIRVLS